MKLKMRKTSVLLIAMALSVSTIAVGFSGCGKDDETAVSTDSSKASSSVSTADSSPSVVVKPKFKIWIGSDEKKSPEVTAVQKLFKEKYGFDFTVSSRQGDLMTALNLKLNSGTLDDVSLIYKDTVAENAFIKSGLVQEVGEFFKMPDKYPNLAKVSEKVIDYSKSADGKSWYIPGWYAQEMDDPWPGWAATAWWVRTDLLEKVGMTEADLSTIEGFENYFRAVAQLKDSGGKPIIPLGMIINEGNSINAEESIILSTFGCDYPGGASKMPGITKKGSDLVFMYDDPNFKNAYSWMSKMYREGLMDIEVPTQKVERYREKINSGRYGMIAGSIWKAELNNAWGKINGPEDSTTWYLNPVKNPKVAGTESATVQTVNPYPTTSIFISKDTKSLDSVLSFLDWCQEAKPERQQEINEGPVGINWNWTGEPLGEWDFKEEYKVERNSGDQARVDQLTPQLWAIGTYSKKWYPWWTAKVDESTPKGSALTNKYVAEIATDFGIVRPIHAYDLVTAPAGGAIEKYLPTLNSVYIEYRARLMMSKSDEEFENNFKKFQDQLEKRAHWSEMKAEWQQAYKTYLDKNQEF